MSDKFNIDGKEYTQRGVSTLEINDKVATSGVVSLESHDGSGHMNIVINLAEDDVEVNEQDSSEIQSIENINENINESKADDAKVEMPEAIEKKETKSWISKILQYIKNIFIKNKKE